MPFKWVVLVCSSHEKKISCIQNISCFAQLGCWDNVSIILMKFKIIRILSIITCSFPEYGNDRRSWKHTRTTWRNCFINHLNDLCIYMHAPRITAFHEPHPSSMVWKCFLTIINSLTNFPTPQSFAWTSLSHNLTNT